MRVPTTGNSPSVESSRRSRRLGWLRRTSSEAVTSTINNGKREKKP
jgi:hypothetical protein